MEKILIFNDYANTNAGFQNYGAEPDFKALLDYLSCGRFLVEAHMFVPIDPRSPHQRDGDIEQFWNEGWLVHTKLGALAGDSYKCDFDVEITLALMRTAEIVKPDIIVLLSGDKDFIPVILELRQRGIRIEVGTFPKINAAREVTLKASGFIDLGRFYTEHAASKSDFRTEINQGDSKDDLNCNTDDSDEAGDNTEADSDEFFDTDISEPSASLVNTLESTHS